MKNFTRKLNSALLVLSLGAVSLNVHAQSGNALDFDGINDYVQIPYTRIVPGITSIQISVKPNNNTVGTVVSDFSGGAGTAYKGFKIVAQANGTWAIYLGSGDPATYTVFQGPSIVYGAWTTLTGVYDGAFHLYVNGVPYNASSIILVSANNVASNLMIGADNNAGVISNYFAGQVDELSLWNTPLSASKVAAIAGKGLNVSAEPNLQFYYKFNQGIGNGNNTSPAPGVDTLIDQSHNKFTGTLHNFALNGATSNWVSSDLVLPITLANFSGVEKTGYNLLQWSTKSEENSAYFEIQRSKNGSDFSAIAKVNAAGNSNVVKNYQYNDNELSSSPVYYYRLNMVDIDGSSKFSPIIFIRNSNSSVITVYPIPARNQVTINLSDKNLINTQGLLSDLNGKVLQRISLSQTSTQVDISRYGSGIYMLKFKDGNTVKIVKE